MNRWKLNISTLLLLPLICLMLTTESQAQKKSFSGEWRTSLGRLNFTANGSRVTGVYYQGDSEGEIRGRFSRGSRILSGEWKLGEKEGRFSMRLHKDGNAFYGYWWKGDSLLGGDWIGVRNAKSLTKQTIKVDEFSGVWKTNYGYMKLDATDLDISGDFRGNRNYGRISGNVLEKSNRFIAKWSDSRHKGKVIFRLVKGGTGMIGEWWYDDNEYGGYWFGVRETEIDGCISGECSDGWGIHVWSDGSRYEGSWKDRAFHGKGTYYNSRGNVVFSGLWANGVFQGKCSTGDCVNGEGTLVLGNGDKYKGSFSDCEPDSFGVYTTKMGDVYTGAFRRGLPNGSGEILWKKTEDRYKGNMGRGRMQGKGKYIFGSGKIYAGVFRHGQRSGKGMMSWANGDRYEGDWSADQMAGQGKYMFKSGDVYEGAFAENTKAGQGTYTFDGGNEVNGNWQDGSLASASEEDASAVASSKDPGEVGSFFPKYSFLLYDIREVPIPISELEQEKEIHLTFSVLYSYEPIGKQDALAFLESKMDRKISNLARFEKIFHPLTRMKQIYRRYKNGTTRTRVSLKGIKYFYYETPEIANQN